MILRIRHGYTTPANAGTYETLLKLDEAGSLAKTVGSEAHA